MVGKTEFGSKTISTIIFYVICMVTFYFSPYNNWVCQPDNSYNWGNSDIFWFILLLKFGNLAIYAGLFWLLRWRDIQSKPELIIPILFFVAYLLPYGLAATVVRMIYPVAPLLVLILADLALRRWRIAKQLLE